VVTTSPPFPDDLSVKVFNPAHGLNVAHIVGSGFSSKKAVLSFSASQNIFCSENGETVGYNLQKFFWNW